LPNAAPEERSGREIRLLLLVIIVAVAGLLVLARFRFPAADIVTVTPTPSPLDRIAVRAPFEEMAGVTAAAASHVLPLVAVLDVEPPPEPAPKKAERTPAAAPAVPVVHRLPALRVAADRLLAFVPAGMRPVRVSGRPARIVGEDAARGLVLVTSDSPVGPAQVPPAVVDFGGALIGLAGSRYVIAVEGAEAGPAVRPSYLPRADSVTAPPWDSPVWQIGGHTDVSAGAFLFTISGQLIGLAVPRDGGVAIVTAATLDRLARELAGPPSGGQ
jgi:hypothetical protein